MNGCFPRKEEYEGEACLSRRFCSEFSRIRNAKLDRLTLDRMIAILGKLDENVEVNITFHPRHHETQDRPNI
jgi:hypothetical protein